MCKQRISFVLIICFFFFYWTPLIKAQDYSFKSLRIEDGLSQATVRDICQDEKSRIWIATLDGLNCYDGNQIKVFNYFHADSVSYGNLHVEQMVVDGKGGIFLMTPLEVFQFDLATEQYSLLPINRPTAISKGKNGIWIVDGEKLYLYLKENQSLSQPFNDLRLSSGSTSLVEDTEGTLWIALNNGGVMRISSSGEKQYIGQHIKISNLIVGNDQNIWVATEEHGVYCLSLQGQIIKHYAPGKNEERNTVRNERVRAICQDFEGNVWLGYNSGLSKIETSSNNVFHYQANSELKGALSSRSITSLFTDRQGIVWIGTYWGGVNWFSPEFQHFKHFSASDKGLSFSAVGDITEDKNGMLWICTEGGGLNLYNPYTESFRHFNKNTGYIFSSDFLKDVLYDKKGNCLWIAADYSSRINCFDLISHQNKTYSVIPSGNTEKGNGIFTLADDSLAIYAGTFAGIVRFDKESLKSEWIFRQSQMYTHNYNSLLLDSKRRLWFATDDGCVAYNIDKKQFETYPLKLNLNVKSQKTLVNLFYEDSDNNIWIGTHGYGLFILDEKTHCFRLQNNKITFEGENIQALSETPNGDMLIGTGHGLILWKKDDEIIIRFNSSKGFPLSLVNRKSLYISRDNVIFLGSINGMIMLKESSLSYPPKVFDLQFSQLYINSNKIEIGDDTGILKKSLTYTECLNLNHSQNAFSIKFYTDNFTQVDDGASVMYRLKGYNDKWNISHSDNTITYTNLSPGDYVLEVRLANHPEVIRSLNITIASPFYATWWAIAIYTCIVLCSLFLIIKEYKTRLYLRTSLDFEIKEKEHIERMNKNKLRFFTNISHEIKTPITLILCQIELLLNSGKLSNFAIAKLANVQRNAINLKNLVTELLDFRKQEQETQQLEVSSFDLYALLAEHHLLFKELATSRNISFTLHSSCAACIIWGDLKQLQKVINNLLSNAFKYTPNGGSIIIDLLEKEQEIVLSVSDSGIGIPANECDKIFDRFYQVESLNQPGGTGIGLALSKSIIEAHHGIIKVESKEGKGTCFKVFLKKGKTHFASSVINVEKKQEFIINSNDKSQLIENLQLEKIENGVKDTKLLIIDDNEDIQNILVEIFSQLYMVEVAQNGKEGYEKVKEMQPDLVISDVMMPEMSGTELCIKIKNNIETCHIPVILLTARSAPEYEFEGLRIGADSYITKPFDIRKLVIQCNNLINVRRMLQNKYAHQPGIEIGKIATNPLDHKFIQQATQIIESNMDNAEFCIEQLSREMGVSRTTLFQKIKGITGETPNKFIINLRLKKAAYLLLNAPEMNISDITYLLGFGNPKYFNKCFKELFGVAPTQYRKSQQSHL